MARGRAAARGASYYARGVQDSAVFPVAGELAPRALVDLLAGRRVVALTGAGCSTESGIPDYRGPETARRARNPIQYRGFLDSAAARRRYWARSFLGWPRMATARPNPAHLALAALERAGMLTGVITQNVDRLHHAAGSARVVELHGALAEVRCLGCGAIEDRDGVQARLTVLNPRSVTWPVEHAPDGDAELDDDTVADFAVAPCLGCGGVLKPGVVFFGESVPAPVVEAAWALLGESDALLVVGSSLTVFSGYRFVRRASERGMPVGIVNLGPTRGDAHAHVRVDARCGQALPALAAALGAR
jgi:NAD+-dependent protein deacetylase sirtuin 4